MSVLDKFKENNKVEEIKFIFTNTFFNDKFNEYLFIRENQKKSKKIGYENNCD